jgi:hypothetical protein
MPSRAALAKRLASLNLSHVERAIAFLWYYRHTQEFEERTASELANDLHDEDFPKPNVTRLEKDLRKSPFTIRGKRARTFQVDVRRIEELDSKYGPMLKIRSINPSDSLIPADWVGGTRQYLERLVQQINACYDYGLYDACAVLCRRLMESLIIEIYVSQKRHADIQQAGFFLQLDALISYLLNDTSVPKSAILRKAAPEVKALGDAAAHDRSYITRQTDIDAIRLSYSRMISELLRLSGVRR